MAFKPTEPVLARCSAAARRADLSPSTLRVWERRYGVIGPQRSPAGQRLYTEEDVRRLKVLKTVVDRGYAIGTVARLATDQLELLSMATDTTESRNGPAPLLKWAIVGETLRERLAVSTSTLKNQVVYPDLSAAMTNLAPGNADILVVHSPSLREDATRVILDLGRRHPSTTIAVVYSFGIAKSISQLRGNGIRLLREPLSRVQLLQSLDDLARSVPQMSLRTVSSALDRLPRLFDDQELAFIEQRATAIACECPTHLTTLIGSLIAFEKYSDECSSADSGDEALHRHIGDVVSQARSKLETLLHRVTVSEGRS